MHLLSWKIGLAASVITIGPAFASSSAGQKVASLRTLQINIDRVYRSACIVVTDEGSQHAVARLQSRNRQIYTGDSLPIRACRDLAINFDFEPELEIIGLAESINYWRHSD